jgi:hypothetical protein
MIDVLKITIATATNPKRLTKHYELDSGTLRKEAGGFMIEGMAQVKDCHGLEGFAEHLAELSTDQAMVFGLPPVDDCALTTRRKWHKAGQPGGMFTRTNEHFAYRPGPSVLMLDYDPLPGARVLTREEIETLLKKAVPEILKAGYVYFKSSSSHIVNTATGEDLTGLRGQRFYIPVQDGTDIPRAGKVLSERLWLNGQGYFMVSKSGAVLERCLVDTSVWQASRLDFASGASCGAGLVQKRGLPIPRHGEGGFLDSAEVFKELKLSERKELAEVQKRERAKIKGEADRVHTAWMESRVKDEAGPDATEEKKHKVRARVKRMVETSVLYPEFKIIVDKDGTEQVLTIAQILDDPDTFDGCRTLDPLEPDYADRSFCACLYLDPKNPVLYSYAHGGKGYKLSKEEEVKTEEHEIYSPNGGKHPLPKVAGEAGSILAGTGEFFLRAEIPMRLEDAGLRALVPAELVSELQPPLVTVWEEKKEGRARTILSENRCKTILHARAFKKALPEINHLSRCPVLVEGVEGLRLVESYDEESGCMVHGWKDGEVPTIEIEEAVQVINLVLQDFDFPTESDKARAIALLLTPAMLPDQLLGTNTRAPVALIEADASQTGKGYLMRLLAEIYGERVSNVTQKKGGVGGLEESLSSAIASGAALVGFDNLRGGLDSPAIESLLTEPIFLCRVPHKGAFPIDVRRLFVLMTSNKAELTKDMANRACAVRLRKRPIGFQFTKYPEGDVLNHIENNRARVLGAVLAIVRYWWESGKQETDEGRHSFRGWVRPMDWIVQEVFNLPPLLNGHTEAQERVSDPNLQWLRDICLAVENEGLLNSELQAQDLLNLCVEHEIDVPGSDGTGSKEENTKMVQGVGRKLAPRFRHSQTAEIDGYTIKRTEEEIRGYHGTQKLYTFTRTGGAMMLCGAMGAIVSEIRTPKKVFYSENNKSVSVEKESDSIAPIAPIAPEIDETVPSNHEIDERRLQNEIEELQELF